MRRPLVAANWKMNGLQAQVDELLGELLGRLSGDSGCDVVICPPSLYIGQARQKLAGSSLQLGAQNCYIQDRGAYTGEISARMLADLECTHVIVGHSERRSLFGESSELVAEKFVAAQLQGLTPILCLGETREQREAGDTAKVVLAQLQAVLDRDGAGPLRHAVIAYEPVWAIGTGLSATPEQAQEVHAMIRHRIGQLDAGVAGDLRILYGGSVKAANAAALFGQPDIDGALVGGASLDAKEFVAICKAAGKGSGPPGAIGQRHPAA